MSARDELLARVRRSKPTEPVTVPRDYRRSGSWRPDDPVGLLTERLVDYRAAVRPAAPDRVGEVVALALRERSVRHLVVPAGVPPDWLPPGLDLLRDEPPLSIEQLDAADGVLTTCALAIAETGTIVLDASAGQGRRVLTLLPDYHLCVVRADQIVANVPDGIAALDPTRPLTWISGPSATSDIELNRVEGVHGPRTLEVVLVS